MNDNLNHAARVAAFKHYREIDRQTVERARREDRYRVAVAVGLLLGVAVVMAAWVLLQ